MPKFIASVMPSSHLILWCHLLLLPSIFPSTRDFSSELSVHIRWPKYWSFSLSISPSSEYSGLISLKIDWFDLLAVQRTFNSLLRHHSSKGFGVSFNFPSVQSSAFYWIMVVRWARIDLFSLGSEGRGRTTEDGEILPENHISAWLKGEFSSEKNAYNNEVRCFWEAGSVLQPRGSQQRWEWYICPLTTGFHKWLLRHLPTLGFWPLIHSHMYWGHTGSKVPF